MDLLILPTFKQLAVPHRGGWVGLWPHHYKLDTEKLTLEDNSRKTYHWTVAAPGQVPLVATLESRQVNSICKVLILHFISLLNCLLCSVQTDEFHAESTCSASQSHGHMLGMGDHYKRETSWGLHSPMARGNVHFYKQDKTWNENSTLLWTAETTKKKKIKTKQKG